MSKIKSFDELFDNIKESLDNPLPIKWTKLSTDWVGVFNTDNNEYNIVISLQDYDVWKFKYFIKKDNRLSIKLTNFNYDTFKVLSTIYKSIYEFIDEVHPNGLIFGAENDSPNRVKLYSNFCKKCSEKYEYKLYETSFGKEEVNPTLYVLYHELNKKELYLICKKVIDEEMNLNN